MVWERGIECAKQSDIFTTFYFNDKIQLVDCSPYGTLPRTIFRHNNPNRKWNLMNVRFMSWGNFRTKNDHQIFSGYIEVKVTLNSICALWWWLTGCKGYHFSAVLARCWTQWVLIHISCFMESEEFSIMVKYKICAAIIVVRSMGYNFLCDKFS